jgi:hypothetical protein
MRQGREQGHSQKAARGTASARRLMSRSEEVQAALGFARVGSAALRPSDGPAAFTLVAALIPSWPDCPRRACLVNPSASLRGRAFGP